MLTSEFDFPFPEEQIALRPVPRGTARLMIVAGEGGRLPAGLPAEGERAPSEDAPWAFGRARDLVDILRPGDALALNDTKVLRARLRGTLETGGTCEVLLLKPRPAADDARATWECMAKPGKKLQPGRVVRFAEDLSAEVVDVLPEGERVLRFDRGGDAFLAAVEAIGTIPLPPYIRRDADEEDATTYQTVFAAHPGSVAAPTASLHLSEDMLAALEAKGVRLVKLTLHVGAGTFRPVQTEHVEDHPMHTEAFTLSEGAARALNDTKRTGGRIVAVGTTAARVLESCADDAGSLHARTGETGIFIYPGYRWKAVDALLTNFHWPKSTLFMLVAARLGNGDEGIRRAKAAYAEAIARGFRLFSYGDGMMIV